MPGSTKQHGSDARAFTILECTVALAMLGLMMAMILQIGFWTMRQRERTASRQAAIEQATNTLEAARAVSWVELTPAWAARQGIAEGMTLRLPEGELTVRVEPEPDRPRVKRVTVEVSWMQPENIRAKPVRLVGLFADRGQATKGEHQ